MTRKTVYAAGAWGMGLLLCSILPAAYCLLIFPIGLLLFLLMKFAFRFSLKEILTVLIVFFTAASFYRIYDIGVYDRINSQAGTESVFSGEILDINDRSGDRTTYTVKGSLNGISGVKLIVYGDAYDCRIGDKLRFKGVPKAFENDYLFNSLDYYKAKGIFLSCGEFSSLEIQNEDGHYISRALEDYRGSVTDLVKKNLPEDESGFICGMLFGDKSGLTNNDKILFYKTGIGHVMAVSGLHLVLFCTMFSHILSFFRLGRKSRFIILEMVMLLFVLVSGGSNSVLRAFLMMTLNHAAPLFFRRSDCASSISIAFILLTLPCPFYINDPSLVLSVTGAFSTGVFAQYMTAEMKDDTKVHRLSKYSLYMLFVAVGIFPASVIIFGESSLVSPLSNMLLTPVCMLILIISLIAALMVFTEPVFLIRIAGMISKAVLAAVDLIGRLSFSGIYLNDVQRYILAAGVIMTIILFIIFRKRKTVLFAAAGTVFSAAAVSMAVMICNRDTVRIAVLGKNEMGAIVICGGGHTQVIDISGNKKNCMYVSDFLRRNNIRTVDLLILKGRPYNALSAYNKEFELTETRKLLVPEDTILGAVKRACGTVPEKADLESFSTSIGKTDIEISGTEIHISSGQFDLVCDSESHGGRADVYAEYGGVFDPPECGAVIVPELGDSVSDPDIINCSNVLITAGKDGRFSIDRL